LSNRWQFTEFNTKMSEKKHMCGVPQGSILGSILFLLHINDLHRSTILNVPSYADDTTVYGFNRNRELLHQTMNQEISKIHTVWLRHILLYY
jgi:hypothetical protein